MRGYFYEPTVISGVRQNDEISQKEVLGPVITVRRFGSEREALTAPRRRGEQGTWVWLFWSECLWGWPGVPGM
jgi:acyl-CoA reductase-like NAD-dependent aldehyde dehydrogenase